MLPLTPLLQMSKWQDSNLRLSVKNPAPKAGGYSLCPTPSYLILLEYQGSNLNSVLQRHICYHYIIFHFAVYIGFEPTCFSPVSGVATPSSPINHLFLLGYEDSNLRCLDQNQMCYHYTISQYISTKKAVNHMTNSFCIYLSRVYYTSKCKDIVSLVRKRS